MNNWIRASLIVAGLMAPVAASAQTYVTTMAPPAPVAETPPPPPGPGFTWVAGFWAWGGSQFNWTPGHWERPPQPAAQWEAPQWQNEGRGYRFRPGRWRAQNQGVVVQPAPAVPIAQPVGQPTTVIVGQPVGVAQQPVQAVGVPVMNGIPVAPPPPRYERPMRAGPGQVWIAGYWTWNGTQHVWTPGHVEAAPRRGARWSQPRWMRRGRAWVFTPGAWR